MGTESNEIRFWEEFSLTIRGEKGFGVYSRKFRSSYQMRP